MAYMRNILLCILITTVALSFPVWANVVGVPHCDGHEGSVVTMHEHVGKTDLHDHAVMQHQQVSDDSVSAKQDQISEQSAASCQASCSVGLLPNIILVSPLRSKVVPNVVLSTNPTNIFLEGLQRPPRDTRA